jgi:membrane protease YdiL (CAAX protease family)
VEAVPPADDRADAPADATLDVATAPRARRGVFEIEGRAAPGLYLLGWGLVATGLGAILVALVAGGGSGASISFVFGIAALGPGLTAGAGAQALQRRADGAAYPGPAPLLVFGASLALMLVAGFALGALGGLPEGPIAVLASVLIQAAILMGLLALVVVSPGSLSWRELGFRRPGPGEGSAIADVAWGITLAIPTLFGSALLAAGLVALLGVAPVSTLVPSRDPAEVLVNLLAAAVIAPLYEETFFRGFATTAWARSAGARAAIVRGAVFFALAHVSTMVGSDFRTAFLTAFIAFAVRLPVGLVLGWVFLRRRTLVAPIALHATYNAIPVLLVALGAVATPS